MSRTSGMHDILKGVIKYQKGLKKEILQHLEAVSDAPSPEAIIYTCVDSRIITSRITQANPGDYFIIRNPGNLIPNYKEMNPAIPRAEEAGLELACNHHKVNTLAVCGHSDCKAMNLVFQNRHEKNYNVKNSNSVLKDWVMVNTKRSLKRYFDAEKDHFKKPLTFSISDKITFEAYIDPANKFDLHDKFSQINTLQQMENLRNFDLVKLKKDKLDFLALWFDVYTGQVYMFSVSDKAFVRIDEKTYEKLSQEYAQKKQ